MNEIDSKYIDSIRLPLAVMVVAIHSNFTIKGWAYAEVSSLSFGCNVAQFFMIAIGNVMAHIAVPTFFLISGYLFFQNFGNGDLTVWKRKMTSRVKTLLIPYCLWIVLFIVYSIILDYKEISFCGLLTWLQLHGGLKMFWDSNVWNLDRVDLWGLPSISSSPILVPFWFMRDLIVCVVVFSPFLYYLFKPTTQKTMRVTGLVIILLLYLSQTSLWLPGFSSLALFYYGLGAFFSLSNRSLTEIFSTHKVLIWFLFVFLFVIEVALNGHNTIIGNIIYPFYVLTGVMSLLTLKLRTRGGKYTFFIFAFHIFVLPFVGAILLKILFVITGEIDIETVYFADKYPLLIIFYYCLKVYITVLVCMLANTVLQKCAPKLCKILCGR